MTCPKTSFRSTLLQPNLMASKAQREISENEFARGWNPQGTNSVAIKITIKLHRQQPSRSILSNKRIVVVDTGLQIQVRISVSVLFMRKRIQKVTERNIVSNFIDIFSKLKCNFNTWIRIRILNKDTYGTFSEKRSGSRLINSNEHGSIRIRIHNTRGRRRVEMPTWWGCEGRGPHHPARTSGTDRPCSASQNQDRNHLMQINTQHYRNKYNGTNLTPLNKQQTWL